ncbi:hypothetical protein E4U42_000917, partial [Claviceps africana]
MPDSEDEPSSPPREKIRTQEPPLSKDELIALMKSDPSEARRLLNSLETIQDGFCR